MAVAVDNLVAETSVSTGNGNMTTINANGRKPLATAFGTGVTTNVFYYFIGNRDAAEYEWGTGHMSASNTLVRDTPLGGSNGAATVSFSAGTKDITSAIIASALYFAGGPTIAMSDGGLGVALADPNADRMVFWDDSASQHAYLALSTGLLITTTNLGLDVNGLTEDTTPNVASDFLLSYSASAAAHRKVKPERVGGLVYLNSGSVSSAATLDISLSAYTAYRALEIHLSNLLPVTNNVNLLSRFSVDGGATYSSAVNYKYEVSVPRSFSSGGTINSDSAAQIVMNDSSIQVSNANTGWSGEARFSDQSNGSFYQQMRFFGCYHNGQHAVAMGAGELQTAHSLDAVRFLFSSGNISSGKWALYGRA